jgi:hypothetical protein
VSSTLDSAAARRARRGAAAGRLGMFLDALRALPSAWRARWTKDVAGLRLPPLPPVHPDTGLDATRIAWAARMADALARWAPPRMGRRCFVRSYLLAATLRRRGLPAQLNVGLRNVGTGASVSGHCWLTVGNGAPLAEPGEAVAAYPRFMGEGANGVRYWAG